jgi:hypothetical protein
MNLQKIYGFNEPFRFAPTPLFLLSTNEELTLNVIRYNMYVFDLLV